MAWRVGIDVGGTFTDLAAVELESGVLHLGKVRSTPPNLAEGVAAGLQALSASLPLARISFLAHGTTAGTNALIEHTGARTGLITTDGFRDLLEIARQKRPSLYDLRARKPIPLVPRHLRREVPERMAFDGTVIRPLDIAAAERELGRLGDEGIEALAICCLHSYANPSHEGALRDLARKMLPGVYVTASSDLLPRFREYERLSTTVVNAYLGPLMDRYLDQLSQTIARAGVLRRAHIMQSNGGLSPLDEARAKPAATVLSGPAAGAAAAADLCERLDLKRAIAMDMGGTSTEACLIEGGLPSNAAGREVGGHALELPAVAVKSIGAGGGSLLWIDRAGLPQVGPRSAGAVPGPACYGRGGEQATLTDSLLVLGRIGEEGLLGGEMPLDFGAARRAVADGLAGPLGLSAEEAALGAVRLAVANVRRAIERITVAQGHDPRDFALIAAGGAGPSIACELAAELQIREAIVPPWPGNFSACGLLASDLRRDWVRTRLLPAAPGSLLAAQGGLRELEREAAQWLREVLEPGGQGSVLRQVSARYVGQDYELEVPVPAGALSERSLERIVGDFHRAHEARYGYSLVDHPVEFVNLIVTATARISPPTLAPSAPTYRHRPHRQRSRPVFLGEHEGSVECPVYDRASLGSEQVVAGPAVIEQYDATVFVPPGHRAVVDELGNLRLGASWAT